MKGVAAHTPPPLSAIKVPGARRVYLARGQSGFGFRLSTNSKTLDSGYSHYASEIDDGGLAQIAGLKVGDRFLEIDGRTVVNIPHSYIKAIFANVGLNSRPLRVVVCPPNAAILAALEAKTAGKVPDDNLVYKPEAPPPRPRMVVGAPLPRDLTKDDCHMVMSIDGVSSALYATEAEFGAQLPSGGVALELFHDPTNPTASRAAKGGKGCAVIVLLEEEHCVSQAMNCQAGGAELVIFVNRKVDQQPRALAAGEADGDRVDIPCINVSMRDGISLAKKLRARQLAATVHPWQIPQYDESDIGTQISYDLRAGSPNGSEGDEGAMNPGIHVEIDGEDCGLMYAGEADFGEYLPEEGLSLEAVIPSDPKAAGKLNAEDQARVQGRVVLVERGGLKIAQKVLFCEQAGARACIVSNTTAGGSAFNIARTEDGGPEDNVTIPTLALGTDDGQRIADAVASGKTVILTLYHYLPHEEVEELPEGWVAQQRGDGEIEYVNHTTGDVLAVFPTAEAVAALNIEKRQAELEAREQALNAERAAAAAAAEEQLQRLEALREEHEAEMARKAEEIHNMERESRVRIQRESEDAARLATLRRKSIETDSDAAALERQNEAQLEAERQAEKEAAAARAAAEEELAAAGAAAEEEEAAARAAEAEAEAAAAAEAMEVEAAVERLRQEAMAMEAEAKRVEKGSEADDDDTADIGDAIGVLDALSALEPPPPASEDPFGAPAEPASTERRNSNPFLAFGALAAPAADTDKRNSNPFLMDTPPIVVPTEETANDPNMVQVELTKEADQKWGLSLKQNDEGILIKRTPEDSPAATSGKIKEGMLIVSVNGVSALGMVKKDIAPYMKSDNITMVLRKAEGQDSEGEGEGDEEAQMAAIAAAIDATPLRHRMSAELRSVKEFLNSDFSPEAKKARRAEEYSRTHDVDGHLIAHSKYSKWHLVRCNMWRVRKMTSRPHDLDENSDLAQNPLRQKSQRATDMVEHISDVLIETREKAKSDTRPVDVKVASLKARVAQSHQRLSQVSFDPPVAEEEAGILTVTIVKTGDEKLGLKIGNKNGINAVKKVIPGGLAADSPIQPGMVVVSVNGTKTTGISKEECIDLLSGSTDLEIKLRAMSDGEVGLFQAKSAAAAAAAEVPGAAVATKSDAGVPPVGADPAPGWLHGKLDRSECESLLTAGGKTMVDGQFLVRQRQKDNAPMAYSLAVIFRGKATHHKIKMDSSGHVIVGAFEAYPKGIGSSSLAEVIEFLSATDMPDSKAPGWPVQLLEGVRSDGSLMSAGWSRGAADDAPQAEAAAAAAAPAGAVGEGARAQAEAKYAGMKRLAMVKEARAKGVDITAAGKDETKLRQLLIDNELEAIAAEAVEADDSVGGILKKPSPGKVKISRKLSWKEDHELTDVETVPRQVNNDAEADAYALYQCRYPYNSTTDGFTVGEDMEIAPGDILQVYDEGGEGGLPQTPEEKEADPNCWMRGWSQDGREGTFPSSYVSKIVPKAAPMAIDSYGS